MEVWATSGLGKLKCSGLVWVALPAMHWAWSVGVCDRPSCLTPGGGAEDDLLIVTCIHSGPAWVVLVELLDCVFCMVKAFCWVPDFVGFW